MAIQLATRSADMKDCIEECFNCHNVCLQSIEHCLQKGKKQAGLDHIRLLMNCAEICQTNYNFMLIDSPFHMRSSEICAEICDDCVLSCEQFSDDEQMKLCAEACRRCAESCRNMGQRSQAA